MKDMIPVHPMEVRGTTYQVLVDEGGRFFAEFNGSMQGGGTRDELYKKLMTLTKRAQVKVEIPFEIMTHTSYRGFVIKKGTATGIHQKTNNVLVRWADGSTSQESLYSSAGTLRTLSLDERKEWLLLQGAAKDANDALKQFEKERAIHVRKSIEEAVSEGAKDS